MLKRWIPTFAVLALAPGVLAGQTGNQAVIAAQPTRYVELLPACDVLRGGHFKVKSGATYLKSALEVSNPANRPGLLNDARRVLLEAINTDGQSGSPAAWYWLGRVYLYFGDITAADSALDRTEQLAPACSDDVHLARVRTYGALINPASTLLQQGNTDSALILLQQAAAFYPESPYAYQNLGIIYFNRKQLDSAAANFEKAVAAAETKAATDTAQATIRNQTMFNLGVVYLNAGRHADAIATLRKYLTVVPDDNDAKRALANAFRGAGMPDSARVIESGLLSTGAGGGAAAGVDPFDIGVKAFGDKNFGDAAKAFHQAMEGNPFYRDALLNLTATYLSIYNDSTLPANARQSAIDSLIAVGERLIALDPMNDGALRMVATGYRVKQGSDPAHRRENQEKTLRLVMMIDSMTVTVNVESFTTAANSAQLKGTATGRAAHDAAGKDLAPAAVTLVFEFLDQSGKPVETKEVAIPALAAGATQAIALTPDDAGIVGWRYHKK